MCLWQGSGNFFVRESEKVSSAWSIHYSALTRGDTIQYIYTDEAFQSSSKGNPCRFYRGRQRSSLLQGEISRDASGGILLNVSEYRPIAAANLRTYLISSSTTWSHIRTTGIDKRIFMKS
jgi:hypothetical protein